MSRYYYQEVIAPKKCKQCGKRTRYVVEEIMIGMYDYHTRYYCSEQCARSKVLDDRNLEKKDDALTRRILA